MFNLPNNSCVINGLKGAVLHFSDIIYRIYIYSHIFAQCNLKNSSSKLKRIVNISAKFDTRKLKTVAHIFL